MTSVPHTLIGGIGNVFFGDDGFGVEVARRLSRRPPPGAAVVDFGIRGLHLAYELAEPRDAVILVDALPRGEAPGTLTVIEPELGDELGDGAGAGGHGMCLPAVFATARALGAHLEGISIVGCEPADVGEKLGLSAPVLAAVEPAMELIGRLLRDPARSRAAQKRRAIDGPFDPYDP